MSLTQPHPLKIRDEDCPTAIEMFARCYLSHFLTCDVPEFHREMYQMLDDGVKRIVVAAPRSFAKSTVYSKIYPLFQILEGYKDDQYGDGTLLISATSALAERWVNQIRTELEENPFILRDYGSVKTQIKWNNEHIICRRKDGSKFEVMAKGAGKQVRGFRPGTVIIDDIETDDGVKSKDQRQKLLDWFDKALINTMEHGAGLVMVGTKMHPECLLGNVMERPGWESRLYKAYTPTGASLWPEKWSVEQLRARELEIGELAFKSEFMNEPILSENPIFVREWFKGYDSKSLTFKDKVKEGLYTVIACDPAISKRETGDYTAIVALSAGFERDADVYVRQYGITRGHWPINAQVTKLVQMYDKFRAKALLVEKVAYQEALIDELKRYCEVHHRNINIIAVVPDKDKERRAHAVASLVEEGRVHIDLQNDTHNRMTKILLDELVSFPTGTHDDLVDAFVYSLTHLKRWMKRVSRFGQQKPHVVLPGKPSMYTGVV